MSQLSYETGSGPLDEEVRAQRLADLIAAQGRDPALAGTPLPDVNRDNAIFFSEIGKSPDRQRYIPPPYLIGMGEVGLGETVVVSFEEPETPALQLAS